MPDLAQGDLVLVPFPFTDLSSKKTRPALVLSAGPFHGGRDVIVCAVTSNLHNSDHSVLVEQKDMVDGTLRATSRIKASKVATLDRSIVRRRVGRVDGGVVRQTLKELRALTPEPTH